MRGPIPDHVTWHTWQFEEMPYLLVNEQFERVQNQTRLEAIAEEMEIPMQKCH